jgi:hypothetical protein
MHLILQNGWKLKQRSVRQINQMRPTVATLSKTVKTPLLTVHISRKKVVKDAQLTLAKKFINETKGCTIESM